MAERPWYDLRNNGFPERPASFGEFDVITPLLIVLKRLKTQMLDDGLVWILPDSVLPGITTAYGIPVVRAPVAVPLLGHTGSQSGRTQ